MNGAGATVVLVRGVGDVGSAVAHRLFHAGYAVAIHDDTRPATSRRANAFTDAVFDGRAELAGVIAVRVDANRAVEMLATHDGIPVVTTALAAALAALAPAVLVDARMRKRAVPEDQRGLAPLTIGLGPNFMAGGNVDLAIETAWVAPGAIVRAGPTLPLAGEPRPLGGSGRERFVYAPHAGIFRTARRIGEAVAAGAVVAQLDATPLAAPLAGTLRGLTHDAVPVAVGTKVIEVDPRGGPLAAGIGERPGRIADGVLAALAGVVAP
jgi:xanthine dehydrogenase accessory factor